MEFFHYRRRRKLLPIEKYAHIKSHFHSFHLPLQKGFVFHFMNWEEYVCVSVRGRERGRLSICCVFERDMHLAFGEKIDFLKPMPKILLASPLKYFNYK